MCKGFLLCLRILLFTFSWKGRQASSPAQAEAHTGWLRPPVVYGLFLALSVSLSISICLSCSRKRRLRHLFCFGKSTIGLRTQRLLIALKPQIGKGILVHSFIFHELLLFCFWSQPGTGNIWGWSSGAPPPVTGLIWETSMVSAPTSFPTPEGATSGLLQ